MYGEGFLLHYTAKHTSVQSKHFEMDYYTEIRGLVKTYLTNN